MDSEVKNIKIRYFYFLNEKNCNFAEVLNSKIDSMKKKLILAMIAFAMLSMMPSDAIMTRDGKTTIVNTTQLGSKVEGFLGTTPLMIYINGGKIVKVEALPNSETPKYFAKVKQHLLPKWSGMTVNKALKTKIDGATGATYSSKAVKENVRLGLQYYKKNKK